MFHHKALLLLISLASFASPVLSQCDEKDCPSRVVHDITPLDEYYATTSNLTGNDLFLQLNTILSGHTRYSYNCVWTALAEADADESDPNFVIGIYTRRKIGVLDRVCSGNDDGDAWNREHVWAKSHGFPKSSQHAYTDLHHLVAADSSVNSDRSNYDFKAGGVPNGECDGCFQDKNQRTFEPPDIVKGQIARMMLYMTTRYQGNDMEQSNTPKLTLLNRSTDAEPPEFGYLPDLLKWHCKYPVSEREKRRNDVIQTWQGNRNPFIDRPEFAHKIWFEFDWENCDGIHPVPEPNPIPMPNPVPQDPSPSPPTTPIPGGGSLPPQNLHPVWINEIHYDDEGMDNDEFVEIACHTEIDLNGYKVILYNGKNGASYNTAHLSNTCSPNENFIAKFYPSSSGIQNGDKDGIALVDPNDVVLEFISYEGVFTANNGPAAGFLSSDIGIAESGSTKEGTSLQLKGTGCLSADFTWTVGKASPGQTNEGQAINCPEHLSSGEL